MLVELGPGRIERDRALQRLDRLFGAAELGQQMAAVPVSLGEIRRGDDGCVVAGEGVLATHQLLQRLAAVVEGEWI